jgi:predicted nuclease of predicted toxin-antitoxin system
LRFIVDAQMPPALAEWIRARGYEASALREIGLRDAPDNAIWDYACANSCVLITKDEDFPLLAEARPGPPIIWVRTGNLLKRALLGRFEHAWTDLLELLETGLAVIELR